MAPVRSFANGRKKAKVINIAEDGRTVRGCRRRLSRQQARDGTINELVDAAEQRLGHRGKFRGRTLETAPYCLLGIPGFDGHPDEGAADTGSSWSSRHRDAAPLVAVALVRPDPPRLGSGGEVAGPSPGVVLASAVLHRQ
ncbi:hypothetical protein GCM10017688_41220 [Streptomyces ramulosus]